MNNISIAEILQYLATAYRCCSCLNSEMICKTRDDRHREMWTDKDGVDQVSG